jgi:error-prone DNA polymerase
VPLARTLACGPDLRLRPARVLAARASGQRPVYRLRTALGREIAATGHHPFLTMQGWRPLEGLRPGHRIAAARRLPAPMALAASDLDWDRVVSIEPAGVRETCDLEIEEHHNFLANDLVVHNSHAASFALLAYASAYLKAHHPAAFYAALLNNQPMGFYHPATIVRDARRHGQPIRPVDVSRSDWLCAIEPDGAVRLGLRYVKGLREAAGRRLEAERRRAPFASVEDAVRRAGLERSLGLTRRGALWEAERASRPAGPLYEALVPAPEPSPLPEMSAGERVVADYEGTGLSLGPHPVSFHRPRLDRLGALRAADLVQRPDGQRVRVAGAVVVRQRPGTARGVLFLNLEDESGLANVIVHPPLFRRHRRLLVEAPFLLVEGRLQRQDGVTAVLGERFWPLGRGLATVPAHDFR